MHQRKKSIKATWVIHSAVSLWKKGKNQAFCTARVFAQQQRIHPLMRFGSKPSAVLASVSIFWERKLSLSTVATTFTPAGGFKASLCSTPNAPHITSVARICSALLLEPLLSIQLCSFLCRSNWNVQHTCTDTGYVLNQIAEQIKSCMHHLTTQGLHNSLKCYQKSPCGQLKWSYHIFVKRHNNILVQ